ncbi:hypothetical protein DFS34DRAFT_692678 [Phlyctochytrium arcticum]|nr:hypothetical protein DFS34DRAFT_692678 [Phlyctochytrium arcticum]
MDESASNVGGPEDQVDGARGAEATFDETSAATEVEFECNICLETASNPIVTLCGHLFCWPCLHQWMQSRSPAAKSCPVCKTPVEANKVVPIYARGGRTRNTDTASTPERPTAPNRGPPASVGGPSAGLRPTSLFGPRLFSTLYGTATPNDTELGPAQLNALLSRMCMMVGILGMIAILLY